MSTLGKASEGIRIGYDKGFDSGSTLDYVYRDKAQGKGLFGRVIDRQYLNSIGWQGIRQRKVNIENIIRQAIRDLTEKGTPVRIILPQAKVVIFLMRLMTMEKSSPSG